MEANIGTELFLSLIISIIIGGITFYAKKVKTKLIQENVKYVDKSRRKYYSTIDNKKYIQWRNNLLTTIYGNKYFTNVFNIDFPVFNIDFIPCKYSEFKKKNLYNKEDISFKNIKTDNDGIYLDKQSFISLDDIYLIDRYKFNKLIKEYKKIVQTAIKYPNLTGFMLDNYKTDDKGRITKVNVKLGTYYKNVLSSHILEYEMYKAYLSHKEKDLPLGEELNYLPFRQKIHRGQSVKDVLFTGCNRYSLLSVQALIIFYEKEKREYATLVKKRTEDHIIAAKLGYYQFVPAGGFELYEKQKDCYCIETIKDNFSFRKALFREYLEEVFNIKEFKGKDDTSENSETTYAVLNHPETKRVLKLVKSKKAFFEILGVNVDLVTLRHTLSFIIRIDEPDFYEGRLRFNDEYDSNNGVLGKTVLTLNEVEAKLNNQVMINQESAALFALAKKNHLYQEATKKNGSTKQ